MVENKVVYNKENNLNSLEKCYQNSLEKNISELVIIYGTKLIKRNIKKDSFYKWNIYENILRASIELNLDEYIDIYFNKLNEKFGNLNGKKIDILKGMIYESKNKNTEALNIYKKCLCKYPCDPLVRTKIINLKKILENDINKVVQLLNNHLKEFPLDLESWHELAEIYLKDCLYSYSLYCFEEILLHLPTNLYYILTCAELYYTLNQYELSSKYFCLSIKIQNNNLRGLWGIILLNITRYSNKKTKLLNDNVDIILTLKCINRLFDLYSKLNINLLYKNSILDYLNQLRDNFK
ncbi:ER membrane protein complex subunit 2, putative [Plasmodium gallinaceum]|uniref:ER membrane protein complex subunit 2 n=1 Tax=Plasmodium gallinaceum TaxID=5849 RepID=A0A1J1GTQ1_PLAGA|nr:ER membrane protein complex subunit 2, putative [Plasmodium gallinaceum]CRG95619.1 ER membrane protein complex subunit 2, putative [Plasmodium gallinaceum]